MRYALREQFAERDVGMLWLLLFRWITIALAALQDALVVPERSPAFVPLMALATLYTLALTLLAVRSTLFTQRVLRSPWLVGGDALLLLAVNVAIGGWHSPLYRYSFAALTLLPYVFGTRGLWISLALLVGWHAVIARFQGSPLSLLLAAALDAIVFGTLLVLCAYALRVAAERQRMAEDNAAAAARFRTARYLHDETVQQMFGVILALKGILRHMADGPERQQVQHTYDQSVHAWEELRRYLQDLREPIVDVSLGKQITRRAADFTSFTGVPVRLDIAAGELGLSYDRSTRLLAILRAALSNVHRHAQATSVAVRLTAARGMLTLEIADDGVGFDPQHTGAATGQYGLVGMHERAARMHGTLELHSQPGAGTRVVVRVPVESDERVSG